MEPTGHETCPRRDLCRFDSPAWLGQVLVDALGTAAPRSIVDLGSGGGALSLAALSRWSPAELVTVDIDASSEAEVRRTLMRGGPVAHRHLTIDVMRDLADSSAVATPGSVDLVVSNPPYRTTRWTPALAQVLERAGLPSPSASSCDVPADLIFVAQALNLVRPGGSLGLVLPDSIVSGAPMRPFREALIDAHRVLRVIQLPRGAFRNTDAQAYVMVVERGGAGSPVRLDRIRSDGSWLPPIEIPGATAAARMDHGHHCPLPAGARSGEASLRSLGVEVSRGRLSSAEVRGRAGATFHTTDFPPTTGGTVALGRGAPDGAASEGWATAGDVLVARVDRQLERKIAIVESGSALLSDCVLRLRCEPALRERLRSGLSSPHGQAQLSAAARGTGPRHISVASVLELRV